MIVCGVVYLCYLSILLQNYKYQSKDLILNYKCQSKELL